MCSREVVGEVLSLLAGGNELRRSKTHDAGGTHGVRIAAPAEARSAASGVTHWAVVTRKWGDVPTWVDLAASLLEPPRA